MADPGTLYPPGVLINGKGRPSLPDVDKWSLEIGKIAGIEHLDTRVVLPVKRGHSAWEACLLVVLWELNHRPK
jgi:hypothetical protein